jgi:hypothetical protein
MENYTRKEGVVNISEGRAEAEAGQKRERFRAYKSSSVADTQAFGNVVARVYANETHAGELLYKVEVIRIYTMSNGSGEAFSFEAQDIPDAVRALKWAATWLWRARRQDRRRANSRWL